MRTEVLLPEYCGGGQVNERCLQGTDYEGNEHMKGVCNTIKLLLFYKMGIIEL